MNLLDILVYGGGALFVIALLVALGLVNAPAGYEDETGFHYGKKGKR